MHVLSIQVPDTNRSYIQSCNQKGYSFRWNPVARALWNIPVHSPLHSMFKLKYISSQIIPCIRLDTLGLSLYYTVTKKPENICYGSLVPNLAMFYDLLQFPHSPLYLSVPMLPSRHQTMVDQPDLEGIDHPLAVPAVTLIIEVEA
jgi:hypothetical protein